MALDIAGCMDRIVALQKEAMAALTPSISADARSFYWYSQERFPYFTNRISNITLETGTGGDEDYGEEEEAAQYDIIMRLVVNHVTAGVKGEYEDKLSTYIPHLITYFNARELLQSATYLTPPVNLQRARIIASTGLAFFTELGITQLGAEFTLRLEFVENIQQVYL